MRGWSIPLGRWMGVELRVHTFFLLLAAVCVGLGATENVPGGKARGLALFAILTGAVVVRETARLIVAAWMGLRLRAILLLPIGGLFAYANPESQEMATSGNGQYLLAAIGPLANALTALAVAAMFLGVAPNLDILGFPLVSAGHLLRSVIWMMVGLAVLHLLPAYPLDCGKVLRANFARKYGAGQASRAAAGLGQLLALGGMIGGMLLHSPWLIIAGFFIMIGAQVEDQGVFFQSVVDTVRCAR